MDTYRVIIDMDMIRNVIQTSFSESSDLFSIKLLVYVILLGVLPSYVVYKIKVDYKVLKTEMFSKFKMLFLSLLVMLIILFSFSKFYASFFREYKYLREHINPVFWMYNIGKYINKTYYSGPILLKRLGDDAKIMQKSSDKKELIIMVVGEAARANRFALNGYEKMTTPLLEKESIVNFSNMYSCGTSTAESVPCMFSVYGRSEYTYRKGISTENILDVLMHTGNVKVLWRDNNSDSKGVALRIDYEDYKTPEINTICDDECRDEGMIIGLDEYIRKNKDNNILIVLHQRGSHGPVYYKRYPKEFEKFTPVCKTNQLEFCTQEEVSNTYDNTILYTDYFLSKVINFLKPYSKEYYTTMFYMSDHGESLGENELYLHGLPYFMAPDEQKHIAALIWHDGNDIDMKKLTLHKDDQYSHDNLFDTLLGLFKVETSSYKKENDMLYIDRKNP